jgi:hypothetical protein
VLQKDAGVQPCASFHYRANHRTISEEDWLMLVRSLNSRQKADMAFSVEDEE